MNFTLCSIKYLLSVGNNPPHLPHALGVAGVSTYLSNSLAAHSWGPQVWLLSSPSGFAQGPSSTFPVGVLTWAVLWALGLWPLKVSEMEPGLQLWVLFQKSRHYQASVVIFLREQVNKPRQWQKADNTDWDAMEIFFEKRMEDAVEFPAIKGGLVYDWEIFKTGHDSGYFLLHCGKGIFW